MAASMDNVCMSLFQSYSSSSISHIGLQEFTDAIHENQLLGSKGTNSIQDMLGHVHSCLTIRRQRVNGLILLRVIINQCSTEVFQQNAERWIRLLLQIIQGHCKEREYSMSVKLIGKILKYGKHFTDISRVIVTSVFQELIPVLLNPCSAKVTEDSIACISKCIQMYPGPLGPFKGKIESFICSKLSKNIQSKVVYRCFALLSQCGPGGAKGVKHTDNWSKQCQDLLGSLELTLDHLYEGFEPDTSIKKEDAKDRLPISMMSHDQGDKNRISFLKSRWLTLCGCLEALLSEEMEATAQIPVDRIVQIMCRALSVNCKMVLSKPTNERMLLASYLTAIHQAVLSTMQQFIVICRKSMLAYSQVLTSLLSQELIWTQTENYGHNLTFSVLRESVYKSITTWLKVLDGCSSVGVESKTWVEQILHDCAPYTESIKLSSSISQGNKTENTSNKKKKKKRGYQEISDGISSQKKVHVDANSKLIQTGLEVLYWLITTSGSELDRKTLQAVHSFTIKTLLNIQQTGEKETPIPYSLWQCRKALYRLLQACVLNPHPHTPPPTQCAISIFSQGQTDRHLEVSSMCIEAMRVCEVVLHPRAPVLNGPIICENIVKIGSEQYHTDFSVGARTTDEIRPSSNGEVTENLKSSVVVNKMSEKNSSQVTRNSLKRPFDVSDSIRSSTSDRSKLMKIQTGNKDEDDDDDDDDDDEIANDSQIDSRITQMRKNELSMSHDLEKSEIQNKDVKDHGNIRGVSKIEEIDCKESIDIVDVVQADELEAGRDTSENETDESEEVYIATKLTPSDLPEQESVEKDLVKADSHDVDEEKPGNTANIENNEVGNSEEVAAMMLTFVDADPDVD